MGKIILVVFVTSLFTFSCASEPKVVEQVKEVKKEFIVTMNFKTDKTDTFNIVLYNIVPDDYQSKWIQINEKVTQTSDMKNVTANFGENISNSFRIGFGNKEEKEIEIESVEVSYGEKSIRITSNELQTYFKFNEFITQDINTYKLQTKKVSGKHNPTIYLKPEYLRELQIDNTIQK